MNGNIPRSPNLYRPKRPDRFEKAGLSKMIDKITVGKSMMTPFKPTGGLRNRRAVTGRI